jgi:hypothetical protein
LVVSVLLVVAGVLLLLLELLLLPQALMASAATMQAAQSAQNRVRLMNLPFPGTPNRDQRTSRDRDSSLPIYVYQATGYT